MSKRATGTFEIKSWDEKPYDEIEGGVRFDRASVAQSFQGDIEGEGTVEYLMAYIDDDTANFVGLQRVNGQIGGRSGSFVLQVNGVYAKGMAEAEWFVVPGSGTGELTGLAGLGSFSAPHGPNGSFTLDYDLE